MRRTILLIAVSALASQGAEARTPFVAEFRIAEGHAVTATAWRTGDDVFVDEATLNALGLIAPPGGAPYRLQDVPGAAITFNEADAAVEIACIAACFPGARLRHSTREAPALSPVSAGFFLNTEANAVAIGDTQTVAAAFEFGAFGPWGLFENTFLSNGVRLDTRVVIDDPIDRTRLSLGDGFTRGGTGVAPLRFAGLQWGTDFSLDPSFVTFPTLALSGEAAAPSVVDVYIDGALRFRADAPAGPFAIEDAPVIAGAGVAHVVVTDVLGRQQTIAQPFYASPTLLRPGLSDFALAAGWLRQDYGVASTHYGSAFASAFYRRGLASWVTAELRIDAGDDLASAGAALSLTQRHLGQFDFGIAASAQDADGYSGTIGWTRAGDAFSFSAALETTSADFLRRGEIQAPAQFGARLAASWRDPRYGAFALGYAARERRDGLDARTLSLNYEPPLGRFGDLDLGLFWSDADSDAVSLRLALTQPTSDGGARTLSLHDEAGALSARFDAHRGALSSGGIGYAFGVSSGARERIDAGLFAQNRYGEARFEVSHADQTTGLRGRFAFGVAGLGGTLFVTRPLRDAFALVDVGAPNVSVWHDGRPLGRTDARGQILATELRAYDANHLRIDVDALPAGAEIAADEITVRPRARSGVMARLPIATAGAGEVVVVDAEGAPLPTGAVLTRLSDGARFPVAANGRVFLSFIAEEEEFARGATCSLRVMPQALNEPTPLRCMP